MKKILALGAGAVLALAPTSTAFAAEVQGTGVGKAYGNCTTSSAGGVHEPAAGSVARGNGGHVKHGVKGQCVVEEPPRSGVLDPSTEPDGTHVDNTNAVYQ